MDKYLKLILRGTWTFNYLNTIPIVTNNYVHRHRYESTSKCTTNKPKQIKEINELSISSSSF